MIASRNPVAARPTRGVNVIVLRNGREVHLDDIETAAEGQSVLDEIDAAILAIEDQAAHTTQASNPDWWLRAHTALKKKRRSRPALQQRIAELRRAERKAIPPSLQVRHTPSSDLRRVAFINAAEALLDRDLFVEIWQRAAETEPVAFNGWGGVQP